MTCLLTEQDLCVPNYIRDYVAAGSLIRMCATLAYWHHSIQWTVRRTARIPFRSFHTNAVARRWRY
jgi:hypothetical protein